MEPNSSYPPIEQYRQLRREALAGSLSETQRAAYLDARRDAASALLWHQQQQTMPGQTLRSVPRARVSVPVTLHLGEWETDTHTIDLSADGCAVWLSALPPQDNFRFSLRVADKQTVSCSARVVASAPQGHYHYVCLCFFGLLPEERTAIEERVLDALIGAAP